MGLKEFIKAVSDYFKKQKLDHAVIGAFALYSYGYVRATQDIDFVTRTEGKQRVVQFLESLGFKTLLSTNSFSNHLHPVGSVRVDIMYVDGITAEAIFKATTNRLVVDNLVLPVVHPEHLIAMKLFAAQNDPERKFKELADIKEIWKRTRCNKNTVRSYFEKYGQSNYYEEVTGEPGDE